jgi:hypothetical protein
LLPGASSALYGANALMVFYLWLVRALLKVKELPLMLNLPNNKKAAGNNDYVDYGTAWQKHLVQN